MLFSVCRQQQPQKDSGGGGCMACLAGMCLCCCAEGVSRCAIHAMCLADWFNLGRTLWMYFLRKKEGLVWAHNDSVVYLMPVSDFYKLLRWHLLLSCGDISYANPPTIDFMATRPLIRSLWRLAWICSCLTSMFILVYGVGVGHLWNMSDWPDPSTDFFISCCPVHLVAANLANLIGWKFPDSPRRRSVTMWQSHPLLPKNPHRKCCQGWLHKPSDKPPALVQLDLLRYLAPARLRCVFKHLWFLVKLIVTVLQVRFAATKASSAFEVRMF